MMKRGMGFYAGCRPSSGSVGIRYLRRALPAIGALDAPQSVVGEASGASPVTMRARSLRLGGVCAAAEDAHVSLLRLG